MMSTRSERDRVKGYTYRWSVWRRWVHCKIGEEGQQGINEYWEQCQQNSDVEDLLQSYHYQPPFTQFVMYIFNYQNIAKALFAEQYFSPSQEESMQPDDAIGQKSYGGFRQTYENMVTQIKNGWQELCRLFEFSGSTYDEGWESEDSSESLLHDEKAQDFLETTIEEDTLPSQPYPNEPFQAAHEEKHGQQSQDFVQESETKQPCSESHFSAAKGSSFEEKHSKEEWFQIFEFDMEEKQFDLVIGATKILELNVTIRENNDSNFIKKRFIELSRNQYRKSYHQLMLASHPDKKNNAEAICKEIVGAYEIINACYEDWKERRQAGQSRKVKISLNEIIRHYCGTTPGELAKSFAEMAKEARAEREKKKKIIEEIQHTVQNMTNTVQNMTNTVQNMTNTVQNMTNTVQNMTNTVQNMTNTVKEGNNVMTGVIGEMTELNNKKLQKIKEYDERKKLKMMNQQEENQPQHVSFEPAANISPSAANEVLSEPQEREIKENLEETPPTHVGSLYENNKRKNNDPNTGVMFFDDADEEQVSSACFNQKDDSGSAMRESPRPS